LLTTYVLTTQVSGYLTVFAFTAYLTRALQYLFGTSRRTITGRAEELGGPQEEIPLSQTPDIPDQATFSYSRSASIAPLLTHDVEPQAPLRAQDPSEIRGSGGPPVPSSTPSTPDQAQAPSRWQTTSTARSQRWSAIIIAHIDVFTYATIFILFGLPIYFIASYPMPAQLTFNVLAYFLALELPPLWRRFLHPALVSSIITIVGIYILAVCHGDDFTDSLKEYQTKTKYQQLFSGKAAALGLPRPGAGDFLSSVLDVSIVALALPMYQYRQELRRSVRSPFSLSSTSAQCL
jgi:hypothetical protein